MLKVLRSDLFWIFKNISKIRLPHSCDLPWQESLPEIRLEFFNAGKTVRSDWGYLKNYLNIVL